MVMLPVSMTYPRFAMLSAIFAFCSTRRTVTPFSLTRLIVRKISLTRSGLRPIEGSSRRSILGLDIRARPMASICCSPPDRVPASWFLLSFNRGSSSNTMLKSSATAAFESFLE